MSARIRMALLIVCAALTIPWAAAQVPQLQPFSADMQINSSHGAGGREMSGKIYITREHMRMDMSGARTGSMITNFATKTVDILMPEQHMYMETRADAAQGRRPGMAPDIKPLADPNDPCASRQGFTCKNLGAEQVNGRSCDHWQITDKNGKVSNVWVDRKLHFPIKSVTDDSTWELTNIQEGEPAASLFEIPAGYQKMDMGSMMQGMRPPQQ